MGKARTFTTTKEVTDMDDLVRLDAKAALVKV